MKSINFAFVIELERHIEILLLKCDCVIVPGLGGFVASHVNARYDEGDNMFIPPLRTLGFNPKLNLNDSLLAQSYSEAYDISYPEACVRIDNEVNELKQAISNKGSYELSGIGVLYLNGDGHIEFTPCEAGILTPDLYSLSSFEMKRGWKPEAVEAQDKEPAGKAKMIPFPVAELGSVEPETKRNTESDKILQIRVSAIRNFVAAVIAVVIFLALGTPVNENSDAVRTSSIEGGVIHNLIGKGYNNIRYGKTIDVSGKMKDTVKAEAVSDTVQRVAPKAETASADSFYIVLASRVTKSNADEFVNRLAAKGLTKAGVLVEKNNSVKVVYGRFADEGEAYDTLNGMRGNDVFSEAWVYHVKN